MSNAEIVIDARRPRGSFDWAELWRFRELLLVFVQRDVAVRYQETALGVLWAVLQPLGMVAIFSLVFGRLARFGQDLEVPYPLFAMAGLLPWMFFSSAVTQAGQSILGARGLISKVYFPRLIVPIAAVGTPVVDHVCVAVIMAGLMALYGVPVGWSLLAVPLLSSLAVLLAIGCGSLVSALIVQYRDARHVLPFAISIWLFLTPVIYPPALLGPDGQWLLYLNPMAGIVDGMRSAWFSQPFDLPLIGAAIVGTLLMLACGIRYFHAAQRDFADVI